MFNFLPKPPPSPRTQGQVRYLFSQLDKGLEGLGNPDPHWSPSECCHQSALPRCWGCSQKDPSAAALHELHLPENHKQLMSVQLLSTNIYSGTLCSVLWERKRIKQFPVFFKLITHVSFPSKAHYIHALIKMSIQHYGSTEKGEFHLVDIGWGGFLGPVRTWVVLTQMGRSLEAGHGAWGLGEAEVGKRKGGNWHPGMRTGWLTIYNQKKVCESHYLPAILD